MSLNQTSHKNLRHFHDVGDQERHQPKQRKIIKVLHNFALPRQKDRKVQDQHVELQK